MKNTITIAFSTPAELVERLDKIANDINISRSALITAILSVVIKSNEETEV